MTANRLIIIGGCPRSGTTLVQNMLDSHPEIVGGPEFLHLVDVIQLRNKMLTSVKKGWIDLFCSADDVDRRIRELVYGLLLPFADQRGFKFLSEKSPENVLAMTDLVELFPHAKFVFVVRDPRAIVASLLATGDRARAKGQKPASHTTDLPTATRFVERCLKAGFTASRAYPDRVFTLQYERLVAAPEAESKALCKFLEMHWSPNMLRPGEQEHAGEAAITVNSDEIWYDRESYYSNPDPKKIEGWRRQLTTSQTVLITKTFAGWSDLRAFEYDLSMEGVGMLRRLHATALGYWIRAASRLKRAFA